MKTDWAFILVKWSLSVTSIILAILAAAIAIPALWFLFKLWVSV